MEASQRTLARWGTCSARPACALLPPYRLPAWESGWTPCHGQLYHSRAMAGAVQDRDGVDCSLNLQAARLGDLDALHAIGRLYQSGELLGAGMPQNLSKAAGYFGRAASAGEGCWMSAAQGCENEPGWR